MNRVRYELPGKCRHALKMQVFAGDPEGDYAATFACDREACLEDAAAWVFAQVHLPAERKELRL